MTDCRLSLKTIVHVLLAPIAPFCHAHAPLCCSEIINLWHVCGSQYRDPLDRALPVRQLMPRSASKVGAWACEVEA